MSSAESGIYRPLTGTEIRLIRIEQRESDDQIACSLEYVPLHDKPIFFGLLYVWGDDRNKKDILLDGQHFAVTTNLYTALEQAREWPAHEGLRKYCNFNPESRLWIDAICINQADLVEKAEQVPRMGQIYTTAERVLAWLGPSDEDEATKVKEIFSLGDSLAKTYTRSESESEPPLLLAALLEFESRSTVERLSKALISIISRAWFSRVWVIQEATLARSHAILIAGEDVTNMLHLYIFWISFRRYEKNSLVRHSLLDGFAIAAFHSIRLAIQTPEWHSFNSMSDLKKFAAQLLQLITVAASEFKSTLA
jgi:hypothetical protein